MISERKRYNSFKTSRNKDISESESEKNYQPERFSHKDPPKGLDYKRGWNKDAQTPSHRGWYHNNKYSSFDNT